MIKKNDQNDQSMSQWVIFTRSWWLKKLPKWLVIMDDFWLIMTSHDDPKNDQNDQSMSQWQWLSSSHDVLKNYQND